MAVTFVYLYTIAQSDREKLLVIFNNLLGNNLNFINNYKI